MKTAIDQLEESEHTCKEINDSELLLLRDENKRMRGVIDTIISHCQEPLRRHRCWQLVSLTLIKSNFMPKFKRAYSGACIRQDLVNLYD